MDRCRLVVFDLDGTLVDTRAAVLATVAATLVEAEEPRCHDVFVQALIGLPLERLLDRCLRPWRRDPAYVAHLTARYRALWDEHGAPRVAAVRGAVEAVHAVRRRGAATAIATARGPASVPGVLRAAGLEGFDAVMTCDEVGAAKPDPAVVLAVLSALGVPAASAWMVGDTAHDMGAGTAAGTRCLGVRTGAHDDARLRAAGAHDVLDSVADLPAWLDAMEGGS